MLSLTLHLLVALAAAAAGAASPEQSMGFACGAGMPSNQLIAAHEFYSQHKGAARRSQGPPKVKVAVWLHVIASSVKSETGRMTINTMKKQLALLNSDFAKTGFSFYLKAFDRTFNHRWAQGLDKPTMKSALHKGKMDTLNVYVVERVEYNSSAIVGECALPSHGLGYRDGIVINVSTVPRGRDNRNRIRFGRTLTHETGHWLGLLHPFHAQQCGVDGDYVDDTPPQAHPSRECGQSSSCTGPETAVVDNIMDYYPESVAPIRAGTKRRG
ncbi:hypothetical protein DCS_05119 [Drechmeria coniospora]|uniref:Peptidase M43 pregnancy-associated plasma-A domain-containing protein n=1 Tax=Drechmeria coniospora TaxID=98403 RepID=A0A151GLY6_DRECN|nr:hypothetical protein DCS_05119 [Drechmeria coniospora]KYK58106.1 hypothetical protein DCS_05119 [Drechmeria coniospora]